MTQMLYTGYDYQKRRIKDWNSGRQSHFAIMTYTTIPGDCIDFVTSQNGDRVDFERLETPRPACKVTLKKNWQSQRQQQHSISCTDVPGLQESEVVKEHWAGAQDDSERFKEGQASGNLGRLILTWKQTLFP